MTLKIRILRSLCIPYFLNNVPPWIVSPFLKKLSTYIKKEQYSNFCSFEIARLVNVPGHYWRKWYVVSCPTWTKNIDRYLTWGAFKVGSMLCKSMALCMGLCNIFCFRIWLAVRIHSRRAWLVAWGLTEWTMVRWGTSSKTWTEVLQRGHEVFSKGTLSRCHSWNGKKI